MMECLMLICVGSLITVIILFMFILKVLTHTFSDVAGYLMSTLFKLF